MSKASVFRIKYLFKKYLDNTCSIPELEELFDLVGKEENNEELKDLLERFWSDMTPPVNAEIDSDWHEFRYQKLLETISKEKQTYSFARKQSKLLIWSAAASILIAVFTGVYMFSNQAASKPQSKLAVIVKPRTPAYVRILKLSDGSTVYLNKDSHLDYPAKFNREKREVYLSGEAYFDIKHDNKRPFFVYAGGSVTQVLGTAFNIKAEGGNVKITVTRGKVGVSAHKKLLGILLPDQEINYNNVTNQSSQTVTNAQSAILWKEPDLVMDNITLKEAANILGKHYGVNILLASSQLDSCRFSASFLNTTQLDQVISVVSHLNNLNVKQEAAKKYVLSGPGCN